jgi:hypothetical protein
MEKLNQTFEKYIQIRKKKLKIHHFQILLRYFPGLLVVNADKVVDEAEWMYIKYIARTMAEQSPQDPDDSRTTEDIRHLYLRELEFLLDNMADWEDDFLSCLELYLAEHSELKAEVSNIMQLFSDASESGAVEEEALIRKLNIRLRLD